MQCNLFFVHQFNLFYQIKKQQKTIVMKMNKVQEKSPVFFNRALIYGWVSK